MPVLITALVAIGIQAAALFSRRVRRGANAPQQAVGSAGTLPVGARRPRRIGRLTVAGATLLAAESPE
jgi:hypothetical protein